MIQFKEAPEKAVVTGAEGTVNCKELGMNSQGQGLLKSVSAIFLNRRLNCTEQIEMFTFFFCFIIRNIVFKSFEVLNPQVYDS